MTSKDATLRLVVAVEPDPGTRRLFHLILDPLEVRLLTTNALDSGEFQQVLAEIEQEVRRNGVRPTPPPGEEKKVFFINGNLLADCDPPELEWLQRFRSAVSIFAVLEPGLDPRPVPVGFHLDGKIAKPLKPSALLAALSGKVDEASHHETTAGTATPPQEAASGEMDGILEGFQSLIAEMDMDRSMIDEMTQSFISRGEEYLEHLRNALNDWDEPELDLISHNMKGMSGNLQFFEMTALCERINQAAKDGNREGGKGFCRELESEFHRVCAAIKTKWRTPE